MNRGTLLVVVLLSWACLWRPAVGQDSSASGQDAAIQEYVERAKALYFEKHYKECLAVCNEAIERGVQDAKIFESRARAYARLDRHDKAIADYTRCIQVEPQNVSWYSYRASEYEHMKDFRKAVADYTQCIRLKPDDYEGYLHRGDAYQHTGNVKYFGMAMADFTKAAELAPPAKSQFVPSFLDARIMCLERCQDLAEEMGNRELAVRYATAIIEIDPSAHNYASRAYAYYDTGDVSRAVADFTEAAHKDPRYYDSLASFYELRRDWDNALAARTDAIRAKPADATGYMKRGETYEKTGRAQDLKKAMADYRKADELDPNEGKSLGKWRSLAEKMGDINAALKLADAMIEAEPAAENYSARAKIYQEHGDWAKAAADFAEAARRDASFYDDLARFHENRKEWTDALAARTAAIRAKPNEAEGYLRRAETYRASGDRARAVADFTEAARRNASCYNDLARFYEDGREWDKALSARTEAIRAKSSETEGYLRRAETYRRKGDAEKADADIARALRIVTEAIESDPNNAALYLKRASVYRDDCHFDRAIADYVKIIRINPNTDEAREAYGERGRVYMHLHEWDKAIDAYSQWTAHPMASGHFGYRHRADAYAKKGDWDMALADYSEYIRKEPDYFAYESRGDAYQARGEFEKANADYAEAVRLLEEMIQKQDTAFCFPHLDLPCLYQKMGRLDRAIEVRDEHSEFLKRGKWYLAKREWNNAQDEFINGNRFHQYGRGRSHPYHHYCATGYLAKGQPQQARAAWEEGIRDFSHHIESQLDSIDRSSCYRQRAFCQMMVGNMAAALADYAEAMRLDPKGDAPRCGRATVYCREEQFDKALDDCNYALELSPQSDKPFFHRGLVYLEKGDYGAALADFEQAGAAPARDVATQAQSRLGRAMALFLSRKGDMNDARAEYRLALRYDALVEDDFLASAGVKTQLMYKKLLGELNKQ